MMVPYVIPKIMTWSRDSIPNAVAGCDHPQWKWPSISVILAWLKWFFTASLGLVDDGEISTLGYEGGYIVSVRDNWRAKRTSAFSDARQVAFCVRRRGRKQIAYSIVLNRKHCRTALWMGMGNTKLPLI
jgi:hypothetical protein